MAYAMTGPPVSATEGGSQTIATGEAIVHPDAELVRRAAAGDVGAFGKLVERYQRPMAALVSRMASRADDVDDIVQELFLRAWKGLPRFRGDSQFSTWLYRIAVNTAIKHKSRSRAESAQAISAEDVAGGIESLRAAESSDPYQVAQRSEREARLRKAVQALPEKHRTVVILHYFEGLSCEEIARIVECPVGTVWSRLHHACQRLKSVLGESL